MTKIIYEVHSNDDNMYVLASFEGRGSKQSAIKYAKDNIDKNTWVEKLRYSDDNGICDYEHLGGVWDSNKEEK